MNKGLTAQEIKLELGGEFGISIYIFENTIFVIFST